MDANEINKAYLRSFRYGDAEVFSFVNDEKLASIRTMATQLRPEGYYFEIKKINNDTNSVFIRRLSKTETALKQ